MSIKYEERANDITVGVVSALMALPHLHKEIEIVYVLDGSAVAVADNSRYELNVGDLFIAFPNQIHYYNNDKPGKFVLMITRSDILFGLKGILNNNIPQSNVLHFPADSTESIHIMNMLESDIKYRDNVISGYMNLLMPHILERMTLLPWNSKENSTLRHILNYCHEHYTEHITLDDLSANLHLSKYYISRTMNNKIGISFNDYINTLRINFACDLLTQTDKKIADISEESGFGTIRSFNRVFYDIKGVTPQEYRNI